MTSLDPKALDAIAQLQQPGKPDVVRQIVELFLADAPHGLTTISDGIASGELEAVKAAAHTLKSSSSYVGAVALSQQCRELEQAARDGNFPAALALADCLDTLFEDTRDALILRLDRAA